MYGELDKIKDWKLEGLPKEKIHTGNMELEKIHELQKNIRWVKDANGKKLEEDLISEVEWKLLKKVSPEIADNFFAFGPK